MDRDKLQSLLDSLDEGPLGNPERYWEKLRSLDIGRESSHSLEAKQKRLLAHLGKKRPIQMRIKLSKSKTGVKIGHVESKMIPVIATNYKTGEVRYYKGAVLAAEDLNLTAVNINNTLKERQATTGGWSFKYDNNGS